LATVRAAGTEPVEVSSLDKEYFQELVNQSQPTKEIIENAVEDRFKAMLNLLEENGDANPRWHKVIRDLWSNKPKQFWLYWPLP